MHGCLDNGSLAASSYLRNANIKTYVEECTVSDYEYSSADDAVTAVSVRAPATCTESSRTTYG